MNALDDRPIFVVGAPRSGTTLLRYILTSHSRIYIPPESNFIPRFFPKPSETPLTTQQAERIIEGILSYRVFFKDWKDERPDPTTFVTSLPDLCPATILSSLYKSYSRQYNAIRWGDKSPIYTSHMDLIAKIFPSAQFIHIVRDGRDVALSMLKAYQGRRFFYVDLCFAARSWKRRVRKARSSGHRLGPDRYFEVRYEDLVAEPVPTLSQMCDFLGEKYEHSMAEPEKEAQEHYHSKGIHAATQRPLSPRSAGRWLKEMTQEDQRLFFSLAGDTLVELGYEIIPLGNMNTSEKTRLIRLQTKYLFVEASRRIIQAAGIFHPTSLIESRLRSH
ncbi:MAG: sulfotransferase [Candidatus Methanosuratincola sp.]